MRIALVLVCVLTFAPAAWGGAILDRTASALRNDPVYVDPAAKKTITPAQANTLRHEIETKGHGPIYVAVLPAAALKEAGGDALGIADELHRQLGARGVYAVVAGGHFRALSTDLPGGRAAKLATQAFKAHHDEGIGPTLVDFVDRVGATRSGANGGGGGGGLGKIGFFPLLVLAGIVFFIYRAFRRRRAQADAFREVKEAAREDLVALADDVQGLEHRVESNEPAKLDYLAALDQYSRASGAFDRSRNSAELAPVAEALDEGRYLMASAEARLDGRQPPERRPPCFFDPRHGPSVRDVPWAPPGGGAVREVPACAADALRVEEGQEPASRNVLVGGQSMPYWAAGPMYGGYFGGFFPGLLIGESLGGFGGFGFGGYGGDVGSGGDSSVGDFGGGGSGDFGGGDFGGGDGGGGDF
jgi:hypothetical protein